MTYAWPRERFRPRARSSERGCDGPRADRRSSSAWQRLEILGEGFDLARTRSLGEGSRRALRLWVEDLRWETLKDDSPTDAGKSAACVRVYFVLPKGSYATTVLGTAVALEEVRSAGGGPPADEEETDGAIAT